MDAEFWATQYGNIASVVGLVVTIVGFIITIVQIYKSRSAAQRAQAAASNTREAILRSQSIGHCSTALSLMEDVKRLHRDGNLDLCLDRLSMLHRTLVSLKSAHVGFAEGDVALIQGTISQIVDVETGVTKSRGGGKGLSTARVTEIVTKQIEKVHTIQNKLEQELKEVDHEH